LKRRERDGDFDFASNAAISRVAFFRKQAYRVFLNIDVVGREGMQESVQKFGTVYVFKRQKCLEVVVEILTPLLCDQPDLRSTKVDFT
jgi:hypothetical protein